MVQPLLVVVPVAVGVAVGVFLSVKGLCSHRSNHS